MTNHTFANIVINRPIQGPFTYSIPDSLREDIRIGSIVKVSFGKKIMSGYVVGFREESTIQNIKPILELVSKKIFVKEDILKLTKWISEYYYSSLGEAISIAIPSVLKLKKKNKTQKIRKQKPGTDLEESYTDGSSEHLAPTQEQRQAIDSITGCLDKKMHKVFLLHGVTGSGKTEVYLQAISYALEKGLSSIVLVPEISLTPQTVGRFRARFGDKIAVLHSRLTGSKRAGEWEKILNQKAQIVIGARSAIFAPVENLGLIVVDEEHENSYKQEETPRYHARDTAIKRAEISNAVILLGSATPSLESFYLAKEGKYELIELPERIDSRLMPEVDIVDMKEELLKAKQYPIFSQHLKEWIEKDVQGKKQVLLFLNRRGFSTFISCRKCGYVVKCKRCSVTLTYHFDTKKLACHHCDFKTDPPSLCPECQGAYLKYWGIGTEKVESETHKLFPFARIERMDTDTTKKRDSHVTMLSRFKDGEIDILIGTQMIAKGLDFPKVTLVGVVSADTALNLPDFRSAERTFNLLTQVAGRAGRGDLGGRVIVQTYTPEHYAIQTAKNHDYSAFYNKEMGFRKELNLPPFCHMVTVTLRGRNEQSLIKSAGILKQKIDEQNISKDVIVLGPVPALIPKVKWMYAWNIYLKSKTTEIATTLLRQVLNTRRDYGIITTVDVDPY